MKKFYTKIAITVAALQLCAGTAISQSTSSVPGSRLLAEAHYYASGSSLLANDSSTYSYPNSSTMLCNEKLKYLFGGTAWALSTKSDYTYNSAGNLTYMQYQNWNASSSSYSNGGLTFYTLNSAGYCIKDSNVLWIPANNAYRNNVRNTYTLNTTGQITDQVYEDWDAGSNALLNTFHYVNTYNAQGNPLIMLTQDWDASIHWMDWVRRTYAYDASGTKTQTITGENSPSFGNPLQLVYQNVYTYNTDGTIATCLSNLWNSASSSYKPNISSTYSYDTAGNNILATDEQWNASSNAYKPYQQYVRTFNSHHQMTSQTRLLWNGSAYANANSQDNYYYEGYTPPAGVAGAFGEDAKLSTAPIPTTDELHIALQWTEAQAFTATVSDMNGRMHQTFSAPASKEYKGNIYLGNLPAGSYVLAIRGELGGTISRMILVQH